LLLHSDLNVTIIQPGQIVGVGGRGFDTIVSQSKRSIAVTIGGGRQRMRTIAIDDLVYYFVGVLNDPRAYQQCYGVGSDDILTVPQMIDIAAEILSRPHPVKIRIPGIFLGALAPAIERLSKLPRGALKDFLDSLIPI
jgi:nucleoside-diphosphate-sugar epimerase